MSPFKTSLIAAILSIAATAGGLYSFQKTRASEFRQLQRQNNQMQAEANRRYLAMIAAMTPAVPPEATSRGNATRTTETAAMPAPESIEYYRNEGNATPRAALQTFAWACDRGDTEEVGRLLHIDAGARQKAEAFLRSLPVEGRAQWKNVDEMAATVLIRSFMSAPFPNADILETATVEPVTPDRVRLRMPDVPRDGTQYQKTADGWKYALTEAVVEAYTKRMSGRSITEAR